MNPSSVLLGVDIGGTKVAAGLVDRSGAVVFRTRVAMMAHGDAAAALASVRAAIDAVQNAKPQFRGNLAGIGICSPGPLDPFSGVVLNPPNLPCWRNFPLAAEVKRLYGVEVQLENDANAAALAEALWGAGSAYRNVFYATLGTGIGTGIVFEKSIYHGRTGSAAEGGHVSIDFRGPQCSCGKRGCIEALASGPALARRAREQIGTGQSDGSRILGLAGGDANAITAEAISQAYEQGDSLARRLLEDTAEYLTIWLGNIVDLLEPDVILIGGGMSSMMANWFERICGRLPAWSINPRCAEIPVLRAAYGEDAGIAGAAALLLQ